MNSSVWYQVCIGMIPFLTQNWGLTLGFDFVSNLATNLTVLGGGEGLSPTLTRCVCSPKLHGRKPGELQVREAGWQGAHTLVTRQTLALSSQGKCHKE